MISARMSQGWRSIPTLWRLIIVLCLLVGLTFRWINLEGKVYQYDETFSSLRVSGYTEAEAVQFLAQADIITPQDLTRYQQPQAETSVIDTVKGLAAEEAQLTPLYFILSRFWVERFGDSVATIRSLSVVTSLLALPCMYWLCWELFGSALTSWLGVAILAVSPFQLLYAQEARPNALWATTILLSSAALLRAMRVQTSGSWLLYAVTGVLNLYTYLFSVLVAIAHGIYVLGIEGFCLSRRMKAFAIAFGLSFLAFLPWLQVIVSSLTQVQTATSWTAQPEWLTPLKLYHQWMFHLAAGFVDSGTYRPPLIQYFFSITYWLIRVLVIYAFYWLCRKTYRSTWLFVLTLVCVPALGLTLPDLIWGGTRSTIPRYMVPVYLGCQLAVTYLLSQQLLTSLAQWRWRQKFWQGMTAIVLTAGVLSSGLILQADTWWNKMISNHNPRLAEIVNQAERPLIISDADLADLLSISHYLDPKVRLLVRPQCYTQCEVTPAYQALDLVPYLPSIPAGYRDVFLFHPRPKAAWMQRLEQADYYSLEVIASQDSEWLWRIKRIPPAG
jgi:uncharacterized membrane protein